VELENADEDELFIGAGEVVWGQKLTIMQRPTMIAARAFPFRSLLTRVKSVSYIGIIFYTTIDSLKKWESRYLNG
jgi:hypothetical protein